MFSFPDGNKADYDFIMKIVKMIGMETKMDRMPNQLSGGEQQRIAIARDSFLTTLFLQFLHSPQ